MDMRLPVGVGLVVAGTVAALLGLGPMLDEGTCASGGPYVIAHECPDDYDWLFWVAFAGVIAVVAGLIVVFLVASFAAGFGLMGAWLVVLGAAAFVKARSLEGDAQLGLDILGWVCAPIGVGAVALAAVVHRAARG